MASANDTYAIRNNGVRLDYVNVTRNTRTRYSGSVGFADGDNGKISVQVLTFDNDGTPVTWSYSISSR